MCVSIILCICSLAPDDSSDKSLGMEPVAESKSHMEGNTDTCELIHTIYQLA